MKTKQQKIDEINAKYGKIRDLAWAKCNRITDLANAEYKEIADLAWDKKYKALTEL